MAINDKWGKVYEELGAKPVINATGSVTLLEVNSCKRSSRGNGIGRSSYVLLAELEQYAGEESLNCYQFQLLI